MAGGVQRAVGIDIGGTNLRAGIVDADGAITDVLRRPTPAPSSATADPHAVVAAVVDVVRAFDVAGPVGVGIAALARRDGWVTYAPNLALESFGLGAALREALGRPVSVGNDATLAGLAEHRCGAGRGVDELVMVTLGTGVGGAVVSGGRLLQGASGFAAELGHVVLDTDGPVCGCGQRGCLESYASGRAIERAARADAASTDSVLGELDTITGPDVSAAAAAGDDLAIGVLERAGSRLGVGLAVIANVLDPQRVVVGGGVAETAGPWLLPAARSALASRLMGGSARRPPDVVLAELGDDAGMIGAGILALEAV